MEKKEHTFIYTWFDEVWNKGNNEIIDREYHPEGRTYGVPGVSNIPGPEGFRRFLHGFQAAFSDIKVRIDDVFTDGHKGGEYTQIARCNITAKHKSGKPIDINGVSIFRIKDGKLMTGWNNFDFLTMNMQLGKITPAQLADQ